jgi:hypothetical protein
MSVISESDIEKYIDKIRHEGNSQRKNVGAALNKPVQMFDNMPIMHYAVKHNISLDNILYMIKQNGGNTNLVFQGETPLTLALKNKDYNKNIPLLVDDADIRPSHLVIAVKTGDIKSIKLVFDKLLFNLEPEDIFDGSEENDPFMVSTIQEDAWRLLAPYAPHDYDMYPESVQQFYKNNEEISQLLAEINNGNNVNQGVLEVMSDYLFQEVDDDDQDEDPDYIPEDESDESDEYFTDEELDDDSEVEEDDEKQYNHHYDVKSTDRDDDMRLEYLYKTRIGSDAVGETDFRYGKLKPATYSTIDWVRGLGKMMDGFHNRAISPFPYLEPLSGMSGIYALLIKNTTIYANDKHPVNAFAADIQHYYVDTMINANVFGMPYNYEGVPFKDLIAMFTRHFIFNRDVYGYARSMLYMFFRREFDGFDKIYEDAWNYCQNFYKYNRGEKVEDGAFGSLPVDQIRLGSKIKQLKKPATDHMERDAYRVVKCVYDLNVNRYSKLYYEDIEEVIVMNEPSFFKFMMTDIDDEDDYGDEEEDFDIIKDVIDECKRSGECEGEDDVVTLKNGDTISFEDLCQAILNERGRFTYSIGYRTHLALQNGANKDAKLNIIYPYKHNENIEV